MKINIIDNNRGFILINNIKHFVRLFHVNGDINNNNIDNIEYDFEKKPIASDKDGYYIIPNYSRYLINRNGELFDLKRSKNKKYHRTKNPINNTKNLTNGYYRTRIINDREDSFLNSRHRLLALAFKETKLQPSKLVVNHKDGVPGNDTLDNIEWTTYSNNLIHAINNNLMPNSVIKIEVLNYNNKTVKKFISIAEAARYYKVSHSRIIKRIKMDQVLYPDGLVYKVDDGSPWKTDLSIKNGMGIRVEVVSIDMKTSKIGIYKNIMQASTITGVNTTSISNAIKKKSKSIVKNIKFMTLDDYRNNL